MVDIGEKKALRQDLEKRNRINPSLNIYYLDLKLELLKSLFSDYLFLCFCRVLLLGKILKRQIV